MTSTPAAVEAGRRVRAVAAPVSVVRPAGALRIVMVVANDVTRDSRVLREAASLAGAGHRVTILGISGARTTAPSLECRDGFVIRRLPFRATPPAWWVPADYRDRIRERADRQLALHRARLVAIGDRLRTRTHRLHRAFAPVRDANDGTRHAGIRRGRLRPRLRAARAAFVRVAHATGLAASGVGRRRAVLRAVQSVIFVPVRLGALLVRVGRPYVTFAFMGMWGGSYLIANRLSGGAIEWLTGWRWRWFGWATYVANHAPDADVWHGHDFTSLPAIVELKRRRGGLAVYDTHEIYLESGRHARHPRWAKWPLVRLERQLAAEVDAVVTVNESVAEVVARRLGIPEVAVVHNCPGTHPAEPAGSLLREAIGVDDGTPLALYHGAFSEYRGIEQLLEAMLLPPMGTVHVALLGQGQLRGWLAEQAADPRYAGRLHVLEGVPPDELLDWLVGVDVAVAPIQPSTLNHRLSSPNKVFEAIAVGTPVAGSDFPEFRRVISDGPSGPLGVLFDPTRPENIADAVRQILDAPREERDAMRRRCRAEALRRWNWDLEAGHLLDMYRRLGVRVHDQAEVAA